MPPSSPLDDRLLLLLQGGLGNQLLQITLAESLARSAGFNLAVSDILLCSRTRRLRGLTNRQLSPLLVQRFTLLPRPWHRYLLDRLAARTPCGMSPTVLTDGQLQAWANHGSGLLHHLLQVSVIHSHATHPILFSQEFTLSWQATLRDLARFRTQERADIVLHVRRTDYLNPRSGFLPLGEAYYREALAQALSTQSSIEDPVLVHVCSDDPAWCLAHLQDPRWHLQVTRASPESDLATMVFARTLITSNSSLSAIAGHLGQLNDAQMRVFTPERWLIQADGRLGDLRKPEWQVVHT